MVELEDVSSPYDTRHAKERSISIKKLSLDIINRRLVLIDSLDQSRSALESTIDRINATLESLQDDFKADLDSYNEFVREAQALAEDASQEVSDYIRERSEKWQESNKGAIYQEWADALSDLSFSEVDMDFPESLESPFGEDDSGEPRQVLRDDWKEEPDL